MTNIQLQKIKKSKKPVGRGPGSGRGKTSGRGMSGQKSRAGAKTYFKEGGQTSLVAKFPKPASLSQGLKDELWSQSSHYHVFLNQKKK